MSNKLRKIQRNNLKTHLGNNKINEFFHSQNDTLAQRLYRGMKNAQNSKK